MQKHRIQNVYVISVVISFRAIYLQICFKDSEQSTTMDTGEEENIGMLDTNLTV